MAKSDGSVQGSFTVLFLAAAYVIVHRRASINTTLLATVTAIWVLSTVVGFTACINMKCTC